MISVIIPVYNVEKYIIRCLESVKEQSFEDFEVILVDDCGNDKSMELGRKYIDENFPANSRVVSHECNQGLSAARNTGILEAKGDYVYFLDSDDAITSDCLSLLYSYMEETTDFVMAKYQCVPGKDFNHRFVTQRHVNNNQLIRLYTKSHLPWNAVNRLIRKSFIIDNNLFFDNGLLSEDLMWNFRTLSCVNDVALIDAATYLYYTNQGSIMTTANKKPKYADDLLWIGNEMQSIATSHNNVLLKRYYLQVRHDVIPLAITWHRYSKAFKIEKLKENYAHRFDNCFRYLAFHRMVLMLMPKSFIAHFKYLEFEFGERFNALKAKLKKIFR